MIAARGIAAYDRMALLTTAAKVVFSASFMAVSLHLMTGHLPLLALLPAGGLIYLAVLVGMGGISVPELKNLLAVFLRRGKKISDIMTEQESL